MYIECWRGVHSNLTKPNKLLKFMMKLLKRSPILLQERAVISSMKFGTYHNYMYYVSHKQFSIVQSVKSCKLKYVYIYGDIVVCLIYLQ